MSEWQPIETAPMDGTYILVGAVGIDGPWVAKYEPVYMSGFRPKNPWSSMMLNMKHIKSRMHSDIMPTHWMPLPEPPEE